MSESLTLAEWRRARNVSQEKLADLCDVHVNTYRRWEENPGEIRVDNAIKIANYLKISLDTILLSANTTKTGNEEQNKESVI